MAAVGTLVLTACSLGPAGPVFTLAEDPARELTRVPFHPQTRYQCGPAALATVLGYSGVAVTPDELVSQVYLPGRQGSLQVEMLAAARRNGRIPYVLAPDFDDLRAEVAAGNPVLVLQDLGALGIRRWHFAVVVGYDETREVVILRSGRERRRLESRARFLRSWQTGNNWAAVVSAPGQVPATATGSAWVRAAAETERFLSTADAEAAYGAALARWPAEPLALFARGNLAYGAGRLADATGLYRQVLAADPGHIAARNNLASALLDQGCSPEALSLAREAAARVPPGSPLAGPIQATLARAEQCPGNQD